MKVEVTQIIPNKAREIAYTEYNNDLADNSKNVGKNHNIRDLGGVL
jgi:hypothetical protein